MLDSEAFPYPNANGRFISATTEKSNEQSCTDTVVDDDDTVVGRMASRHAARLREILDAARKQRDGNSKQDYYKIKVGRKLDGLTYIPQPQAADQPLDSPSCHLGSYVKERRQPL
jgi:hypothetical protein